VKPETVSVREAARRAGCSTRHIRTLITRRKLKADKIKGTYGYHYAVDADSLLNYINLPQPSGWPRGRSRKSK